MSIPIPIPITTNTLKKLYAGQWASTRSDMFPDALCQALSDLHADAPAHSWKVTQKTVEEALCIPKGTLYQVFEEFDQSPVASGSIAQVHRAVLRPNHNPMAAIEMEMNDSKKESQSNNNNNNNNNKRRKNQNKNKSNGSDNDNDNDSQNNTHRGTPVAIKVRHPNVSRLIDMDFRLMSIIADVADCIPALSWLRVRESVEQFSHTMAAQAHLNVEAHHLEVLNHNFRHWDTVQFPSPLFACSSVIIESFEKGNICSTTIDKYDSLAAAKAAAASTRKSSSDYPIVEEVNEEGEEVNHEDNKSGHELMPVPLAKFIVTTGLSIYLKMLLVDNLMHADLHPGNILLDYQLYGDQFGDNSLLLNNVEDIPVGGASSSCSTVRNRDRSSKRERGRKVRSDKKKSTAAKVSNDFYGRISLVDAGMVAQLDDDESTNFIGLISALGEGDGRAAAEAILRFKNNIEEYEGDNDHNNLTLLEREGFIEDVIDLFEERCRGYGTNVDFGSVLRGVLGIVKKHHIQLGANYATLVVNALCIESLAKRVCPSYNVLDASKPLLKAYGVLTHDDSNSKKGFFSNRPEVSQHKYNYTSSNFQWAKFSIHHVCILK
jgi:aarF domain-containing kinase